MVNPAFWVGFPLDLGVNPVFFRGFPRRQNTAFWAHPGAGGSRFDSVLQKWSWVPGAGGCANADFRWNTGPRTLAVHENPP